MSHQEHPSMETLVNYTESPNDPQHLEIALHIAKCQKCRNSVSIMRLALDNIALLANSSNDDLNEPSISDEQIVHLIEGKLDATTDQHIRKLMEDDAYLTKRVLHYATNVSKNSDTNKNQDTDSHSPPPDLTTMQQNNVGSITEQLKHWFEHSISAKVTTPIVAAAAAALVTISIFTNSTDLQIVAYQDDPTISIFESPPTPGMGFFKQTEIKKKPFAGLIVQAIGDNQVSVQWPAIKDAISYELTLNHFSQGKITQVLSQTTTDTLIKISQPLISSSRYEWVLKGKTQQGGEFKTHGGFVVN